VNGLDKEGAGFDAALETCRTQFECTPVPMVLPVHDGSGFNSVVDVLEHALIRSRSTLPSVERVAVPPDMEPAAQHARKQLIEAVAESDEGLLNRYLEQGDLPQEQLIQGLRNDILTRQFLPVYAGSALHNVGTWSLPSCLLLRSGQSSILRQGAILNPDYYVSAKEVWRSRFQD